MELRKVAHKLTREGRAKCLQGPGDLLTPTASSSLQPPEFIDVCTPSSGKINESRKVIISVNRVRQQVSSISLLTGFYLKMSDFYTTVRHIVLPREAPVIVYFVKCGHRPRFKQRFTLYNPVRYLPAILKIRSNYETTFGCMWKNQIALF